MNTPPTTILGIDPGYGRVGYGVIRVVGGHASCVAYGCIETSPRETLSQRLVIIAAEIRILVRTHAPHIAAIERLFFSTNTTTAMDVAHARGVILLTLAQNSSLPIIELSPLQVKQAATGSGNAPKQQVQTMIARLLKLDTIPKPDDAADALAIALCASTYRPTVSL